MAKKLNFTPLGDKVVIKPVSKEGEKKLASGIILPASADKDKLLEGQVVAIGKGRWNEDGDARIPMQVALGDVVLFKKPWDEPIKIDGVEYYVLPESEITLIEN